MIAIVAFQILKSSVQGPLRDFVAQPVEVAIAKAANAGPAAVLYILTLIILYYKCAYRATGAARRLT